MALLNSFKRVNHICCVRFCARNEPKYYLNQAANVLSLEVAGTEKKIKWDSNWDMAAPIAGHSLSSATRHIFLIRHGKYNTLGKSELQKDLTDIGELQSNTTGIYLSELGHKYSEVTTSDMLRSISTAKIITNSLPSKIPLVQTGLLRECHMISPDPENAQFNRKISKEHPYVKLPMIEAGFRKIFYRALPKQKTDSYHIVVGHLNVFCYFIARVLQVSPRAWVRFSLKHCSITEVVIGPDGSVWLESCGDSGHLDPDFVSTS